MTEKTVEPLRGGRLAIALWGAGGVALLLTQAIVRLTPRALEPLAHGAPALTWRHVALYAASVLFMGFFEGYQAFQKGFSPRVAARSVYLARHPKVLHVILAVPYSMGLYHASRRRLVTSWSVTLGVIVLIVIVHNFVQPWRGIVDGGVVVGLLWGVVAIFAHFVAILRGAPPGPMGLPPGEEEAAVAEMARAA